MFQLLASALLFAQAEWFSVVGGLRDLPGKNLFGCG